MDILHLVIVILVVVFSVVLHELAHGVVAYFLGDNTAKDAGRLTLNPLKHIDPFMSILVPVLLYIAKAPVFGGAKPVPINYVHLKWKEWGMALVAVAGPATNFVLAFIGFMIGHFTGWIYGVSGETVGFLFSEIVLVNIGFMIFNLIPIPPLDGSRVLYAISPDGMRKVMASIELYGIFIIYGMILIFGQVFSEVMIAGMQGILDFFYLIVGG